MNRHILETEVQAYLLQNAQASPAAVALTKSPFREIRAAELAEQIESRARAKVKLPTWHQTAGIYYPKRLNLEQSSSEATAMFKASLLFKDDNVLDMTGGMGVDSWAFSREVARVTHCELDTVLSDITAHNLEALDRHNVRCLSGRDGVAELLESAPKAYDCCFIDPARRVGSEKVFLIQDCQPDLLSLQEELFQRVERCLVKLSPMLDIKAGIRALHHVKAVYVVGVQGECKEILIEQSAIDAPKNPDPDQVPIHVVILDDKERNLSFTYAEEQSIEPDYDQNGSYLYDPDSTALKSGGFNYLSKRFKLKKLHASTHLYLSDELHKDFPGRVTKVQSLQSYGDFKKTKGRQLHAVVVTRNFPLKVVELRKKHRIAEGSQNYLYFCTNPQNELMVFQTSRV